MNIAKVKEIIQRHAELFPVVIACVAWRFWLGTLSNKGGRGKRNREETGAGATSWPCRSFLRTSRMKFVASPLMRPAQQNHHATKATVVTFIFSPPNWREATTANTTATELGDYSEIWCNPPPIRTHKIQDGKEKKSNAWCMSIEGMLKIPFDWYITATIPYFPYKPLHFERTMPMLIYILSLGYKWFYSNHLRIITGNYNRYSCQNHAYIFLIICIKHCLCQLLVYEK